MNGAQALLRTFVDAGVDVCFANPGTSEMHFVAALDDVPEMRGVLALFEGVVTGAADGYGRMAEKPSATLLHLGPGLGNGLANLHNARRARSPIVNVVGDHALDHKALDAPLESDIDSVAHTLSTWVRRSSSVADLPRDAVEAVAATSSGHGSATLILPADIAWTEGAVPAAPLPVAARPSVGDAVIASVAEVLAAAGPTTAVLVGSPVLTPAGSELLERLHHATGATILHETFAARATRGASRFEPTRLQYLGERAAAQLEHAEHLILIGTTDPVAFFAYPGKPGRLAPEGCEIHTLAEPTDDCLGALRELVDRIGGDAEVTAPAVGDRPRPTGPLDPASAAAAVAATLPEHAIVSDEAATSGGYMQRATASAPQHDWMMLMGGAIGQGMPVATGAAVACPDRPVLNLEADGSAMYTIQSLWTQAREELDVTTVIFNNGAYAILEMELNRVGADAGGPVARGMFDLTRPELDFCQISEGLGVPATRATTAEELTDQLDRAYAEPGPHLIEAMLRP